MSILYGVVMGKNSETGQVKLALTVKTFSLVNQTLMAEHWNEDGSTLQQYLAEVEAKEVFSGWIDDDAVKSEINYWAEELGGLKVICPLNQATSSLI